MRSSRVVWACWACVIGLTISASLASAGGGKGTRSNPYRLKTLVGIPESDGWSVRVNGSTPNATQAVLAENQFNDPPARGRQFFMINVRLVYRGKGSEAPFSGLSFAAVGKSNVAYEAGFEDSCGVIPRELDTFRKVFSGGSLTGNICFAVRSSDARSLLLYVEPSFSFKDVQLFFALR